MFDDKQSNQRAVCDLMQAMQRIRGEAEVMACEAQLAIEHHSFDRYRLFRSKIEEHEAVATVIRARTAGAFERDGMGDGLRREERLRYELLVRASLRFFYALSATPMLPMGARETFIGELESLVEMRKRLESPEYKDQLSAGIIDDLDTARIILEEIAEKAPQLLDFSKARAGR